MPSSTEKLRWSLLGGVVLLACVIGAIFGLANYRAGQIWRRILARNGVNLRQETDGFTYSQSDGKRTIFTLHAARAVPHGKGHWSLSNAVLVLYAKDGRTDRIYGSQFEYNQETGVAQAVGEVHMDLQAPSAAGKGGAHPASPPDLSFTPEQEASGGASSVGLIHVRTSGLVYVRKLGVAATKERTEFHYRGLTCTSQGAEFNSEQNLLRLLADVHLGGTLRNDAFSLTAAHVDLDRTRNTVELAQPVLTTSDNSARAGHALLHLRPAGTVESGVADDRVELREGPDTVSSPTMQAAFTEESRPEHAILSNGVRYLHTDAASTAEGRAQTLEMRLSSDGRLQSGVAIGDVHYVSEPVAQAENRGQPPTRRMQANAAVASFVPEAGKGKRAVLETLRLKGNAEMLAEAPSKAPKADQAGASSLGASLTRIDADDLTTTFTSGTASLQPSVTLGTGHTQLEQRNADGSHQVSAGDAVELHFAQRPGPKTEVLELATARQTGNVTLRSWGATSAVGAVGAVAAPTVGHAATAMYEAGEGTLTLLGNGTGTADLYDGATQLAAPKIVLHEGTGDGEASGGVVGTTSGAGQGAATHVLASRAAVLRRAGQTQFFGTDTEPARLWQAGSQVEAARLVLDGQQHILTARPAGPEGGVHAIFADARPAGEASEAKRRQPAKSSAASEHARRTPDGEPTLPEASRDALDVRSATMDYNQVSREAVFAGGVRLRGPQGEVTGEHGVAFLAPPVAAPVALQAGPRPASAAPVGNMGGPGSFGGRLTRFVLLGKVRLLQPGRTGAGEQLTYTASTNNFVLTGTGANLPRVHDAQQGFVTGATLVFGGADSSIVVAGSTLAGTAVGATASKPTRVHTETELKQP